MLRYLRRTPSGNIQNDEKPLPPPEPPRGNYLRRHHMQTTFICVWVLCIIAYIVAIEKAIYAHGQLTPSGGATADGVGGSFGRRGTRRRQETVQIFSFARTVLTAVHVCSLSDGMLIIYREAPVKGIILTIGCIIGSNNHRHTRNNPSNPNPENPRENRTKTQRRAAFPPRRPNLGWRRRVV